MNLLHTEVKKAKDLMEKAVEAVRREFTTVRTGKATPALLETVRVEAYGSVLPLNQVATISAPEPRLLTVQPWDRSLLGIVERAIQSSDLGLNPSNDGTLIRVPIPPLTEERRRELVRVLHRMAEEGRVSVRHARQMGKEALEKAKRDGKVSEDDERRHLKELQNLTDEHVAKIDAVLKTKEQEVMEF
ncbi:MAG: ribosome recycling factor [Gemmatimonadetes bacterium]|nr:ribosome recycling factor [Gemmatimonadota bacterium]